MSPLLRGSSIFALTIACASCAGARADGSRPARVVAHTAERADGRMNDAAGPARGAEGAKPSDRADVPAKGPEAPAREHGPTCNGAPGAGLDCNGESCCTRLDVPAGEQEGSAVAAFSMDKYEVTVGRVRAWVAAGRPAPAAGEQLSRDASFAWPSSAKVQTDDELVGWARYDTWKGGDDRRPKNFVTWYTAAAVCRFDGGRLPTSTEWTYAARGGPEHRPYPWGVEPPTPERALFNCRGDGNPKCALTDILPVGSRPLGAGRWGHMDLAGSMFEWTATADGAPGPADLGPAAQAQPAGQAQGGGFCYIGGVDRRATTELRPFVIRRDAPTSVSHMVGFRCVYPGAGPRGSSHAAASSSSPSG